MNLETFFLDIHNVKKNFTEADFGFKLKPYTKVDFHGGAPISRETLDEWRIEILKQLSESDDKFTFYASGNSFVLGYKVFDGIKIVEFSTGRVEYQYKNDDNR